MGFSNMVAFYHADHRDKRSMRHGRVTDIQSSAAGCRGAAAGRWKFCIFLFSAGIIGTACWRFRYWGCRISGRGGVRWRSGLALKPL